MATTVQDFGPFDAVPVATNYGTLDVVAGTNFPVPAIDFDPTTAETVYFFFRATNYGSGNLTLKIDWYADTGSSSDVVWGAAIAAITPDTDTQDIETKAFATAQTVSDTHLGTTGQRLHEAVLTLSNLDSIANGDWVCLKFYRDAAADGMTGDASVVKLSLSYSDT